ncbi:FtsX-like permease family protein [Streptosporangium sp. NPDC050280]|uniref:FtsX-like permease family protein n=1 Tax=unclassified Streptosporangium TaxID=2632669 RepID=UPI003426DCDD
MFVVLGMGMAAVGLILKGRFPIGGPYGATLSIIIGAVILLLGLVLAATWLIRAVARHVAHRATAPETLLAARMIEADPRGWARALSVVGLTVFFGSAVGVQQGIILFRSSVGTFPLATYLLVDSVLLIAMCTSTAALVVRQAEELLDHRRSLAALAAAGAPMRALRQALTRQALIATLPVCAVAAATGAGLAFLIMFEGYNQSGSIAFPIMRAVVTAGIGVLASMLVAQASWPILRSALRPEELRTE